MDAQRPFREVEVVPDVQKLEKMQNADEIFTF